MNLKASNQESKDFFCQLNFKRLNNKKWENQTYGCLYDLYPTEYAKYRLHPFIRPDKVFFNGCCKLILHRIIITLATFLAHLTLKHSVVSRSC